MTWMGNVRMGNAEPWQHPERLHELTYTSLGES